MATVESGAAARGARYQAHSEDVSVLARGAGITALGGGFSLGLGVIAQLLVARFLGPQRLGLYSIGMAIERITSQLAPASLGSATVYYGSRWRSEPGRLRDAIMQAVGATLGFGTIIAATLYFLAPWLAHQVFRDPPLAYVIRCLALGIAVIPAMRVASAATTVSYRMQYRVFIDLLYTVSFLGIFLILCTRGFPLRAAVFAVSGSGVAGFVFAIFLLTRLFPEIRSATSKYEFLLPALLAYAFPAFLSSVFSAPLESTDRLLVGYFCPPIDLGYYQAASQASMAIVGGNIAIGFIASPMIASLYSQREILRLQEIYRVSTKWVFFAGLLAGVIIILNPADTLHVIYGPKFTKGHTALLILSLARLVGVSAGSSRMLLLLTGNQIPLLKITSFTLGVHALLTILLTPRFGISGAAAARVLANAFAVVITLITVRNAVGIWPYDSRILKGLLAAAVAAAMVLAVGAMHLHAPIVRLLASSTAAGLGFGGTLLVTGLDLEDLHVLRSIRRRREQDRAVAPRVYNSEEF